MFVTRRRKSTALELGRRGLKQAITVHLSWAGYLGIRVWNSQIFQSSFTAVYIFCLALASTSEDLSAIRKLPFSCVVETAAPGSRHTENKLSIFIGVPRGFVIAPLLYMLRGSPWRFYRGFGVSLSEKSRGERDTARRLFGSPRVLRSF